MTAGRGSKEEASKPVDFLQDFENDTLFGGKGLNEPVATLDVTSSILESDPKFVGQMEAGTSIPQGQRSGQAAHRLIQLLC